MHFFISNDNWTQNNQHNTDTTICLYSIFLFFFFLCYCYRIFSHSFHCLFLPHSSHHHHYTLTSVQLSGHRRPSPFSILIYPLQKRQQKTHIWNHRSKTMQRREREATTGEIKVVVGAREKRRSRWIVRPERSAVVTLAHLRRNSLCSGLSLEKRGYDSVVD